MNARYKRLNQVEFDNPLPVPDVEVQNFKSSKVYVFGNADLAEEDYEVNTDDAMEMSSVTTNLRVRGQHLQAPSKKCNENTIIEREIADGDTLHNIALKYGCTVSELKRINNLIQDQDFFALKIIKVPIKLHGLLSELIEEEKASQNCKLRTVVPPVDSVIHLSEANEDEGDEESAETQSLLVQTLSIRGTLSNQGQDAQTFLQKMDKDLKAIVESTKNHKDSLEEVAASLTCRRIYPFQRQESWLNGVDCGMRWWSLLIVMFVIGLLLPAVYFMYYKYTHPDR